MRRKQLILILTALAILGALVLRARSRSERSAARQDLSLDDKPSSPEFARKQAALPRLVELGSDSCASCKAMMPVLAKLRKTHAGALQVDFIDVWKSPDAAQPFKVFIIPTQVFLAPDGKELARHEGFYGVDAIRKRWASLGYELSSAALGTEAK